MAYKEVVGSKNPDAQEPEYLVAGGRGSIWALVKTVIGVIFGTVLAVRT